MNSRLYKLACRAFAILVVIDGISIWMYLIAQLTRSFGDEYDPPILDLLENPELLVAFIPGLIIFIIAWWLWQVPKTKIPSEEFTLNTDAKWMIAAMKMLGIYLFINSVPAILGLMAMFFVFDSFDQNISSLWANPVVYLVQIIFAYFLLFQSDWCFRKFVSNEKIV